MCVLLVSKCKKKPWLITWLINNANVLLSKLSKRFSLFEYVSYGMFCITLQNKSNCALVYINSAIIPLKVSLQNNLDCLTFLYIYSVVFIQTSLLTCQMQLILLLNLQFNSQQLRISKKTENCRSEQQLKAG